jgi:monoterpene epsilon-lactone hydrolase
MQNRYFLQPGWIPLLAFFLIAGPAWLKSAKAQDQSDPTEAVREVPPKSLVIPSTVSEELAKIIGLPIPTLPSPKTTDQWLALQSQMDAARSELTIKTAAALGAKITEIKVAGVTCYRVDPKEITESNRDRLLIHLHGGAYVLGSGIAATLEAVFVATACKTPVISVDYRVPPEHPFPAALEDSVAVWQELIQSSSPEKMALFGTSAGGGLTLATVIKLKELKLPLPAVLFVGTPASDLTKTGDSYYTNADVDNGLGRYEGFIEDSLRLYAGDLDMKNPYLSPVYGDLDGFPPTVLISGTRDLLLSNTVRIHRKLRAAGVKAELHVYEGQSHADYLRAYPSPEAEDAFQEIALFFDQALRAK